MSSIMGGDAKLGIIVGVVLVVVMALLFFHEEPGPEGALPADRQAIEAKEASEPSPAAIQLAPIAIRPALQAPSSPR